jgi:drug/metabolite transporter (DMT)-like permease
MVACFRGVGVGVRPRHFDPDISAVIGFTAYLLLVGRMGPDRAAYSTVLFPIVALTISTIYEGYHWTPPPLCGLVLMLAGNLLAFLPLAPRTKSMEAA